VTPGDQVAVSFEDRVGTDQQLQTPQCWSRQRMQQRRQPRSVDRFEPDLLSIELALQHRQLMS